MNLNTNELTDYYNRVFVRTPPQLNKPLSGLSYRLAGILIGELNFYQSKKLPQRKYLASTLNVSTQAILDSLSQLEDVGFIIRTTLDAQIVSGDANEMEKKSKFYTDHFKKERKSRRFNDEFFLNYYYNSTEKEQLYSLLISIIEINGSLVAAYNYISKLNNDTSILNKIILDVYNSTKSIEYISSCDKQLILDIIKDILNNSSLTHIPTNNSNINTFIVYIDRDKLLIKK